MPFSEALRILIEADTRGAVRSIDAVAKSSDKLGKTSQQTLDRWGRGLTVAGAGAVAFGSAALVGLGMAAKSAAELEQAVGSTEAVFGEASGAIDEFAKGAADAVGLSQTEFRNLSSVVGAQLKNMGFSLEEAADQSIDLVKVGADLAATYGGTTRQAVEALGAALRGEADPAERFGLMLNQTAVNAKAVELGLAGSTGQVDASAKAQATLALITEQSADAQGQFAREADTASGKQQRLAATAEDLKAAIGEGALPVMEAFLDITKTGVDIFQDVNDATGGVVGKLAAIGSVGLVAGGGLSFAVGQALLARQRFADAASAISGFTGNVAAMGRAGRIAGGLLALGLTAELIRLNNERFPKLQEIPRDVENIITAVREFNEGTKDHQAIVDWSLAVGDLDDAMTKLLETSPGLADDFIRSAEAAGIPAGALADLRARVDEHRAATKDARSAEDEWNASLEDTGDKAATAAEQISAYNDALRAQFDPVFGVIDAQAGLNDALARQAEVYKDAESTAQDKASADQAVREAVVQLDGAAGDLNRRIADQSLTVQDARDRFITMATQMGLTRGDAIRLADGMLQATDRARDLGNTDPNVDITATDRASDVIKRVKGRVVDLDGRTASILIQTTHRDIFESQRRGGTTGGPQIFHEGGIVPGRRGEEVAAILQAGEAVIPLSDMGRPMPAFGVAGGQTVNVNISVEKGAIVANDPAVVTEGFLRHIRTNGAGQVRRALGIR